MSIILTLPLQSNHSQALLLYQLFGWTCRNFPTCWDWGWHVICLWYLWNDWCVESIRTLILLLSQVMQGLAKSIAWDGEGATCLIEVYIIFKDFFMHVGILNCIQFNTCTECGKCKIQFRKNLCIWEQENRNINYKFLMLYDFKLVFPSGLPHRYVGLMF